MLFFSNKNSLKSLPLFIIFNILTISFSSDCQYPNNFTHLSISNSSTFYLRKINSEYYLVGNEKEGTDFKIQNIDDQNLPLNSFNKLGNNYKVYTDIFGNFYPKIGINDNKNKLKYIISESSSNTNKYTLYIYDTNGNSLKSGKFSNVYPDYEIIEVLNDDKFIGAVKIINTDLRTNVKTYSIKLQVMSFSELDSKNNIKQLSGKEYMEGITEYSLNNISLLNKFEKELFPNE